MIKVTQEGNLLQNCKKNLSARQVIARYLVQEQMSGKTESQNYKLHTPVQNFSCFHSLFSSRFHNNYGGLRLVQADWRAVLPRVGIPCLNIVAKQTRCFKSEGVEYVSKHIPDCKTVCHMHTTTELGVAVILKAIQQSAAEVCGVEGVDGGGYVQLLLQAYFDTAGHWLYIEQPEAFNKLVLQFVLAA